MNRPLLAFLVVAGVVIAVRCLSGCLSDQTKRDVAADVYAAQQAACIDQYADREHIDKCRERVKKAWAADAGQEAGK